MDQCAEPTLLAGGQRREGVDHLPWDVLQYMAPEYVAPEPAGRTASATFPPSRTCSTGWFMVPIATSAMPRRGCSVGGYWHADCVKSRHVSRVISVSPELVYEFASNPDNLPKWAAGLAKTEVVREGDVLLVDSPMGKVTVRFVPLNEYGVIDHDVTLPSGTTVTNPVRVLAHPEGSEILFTIRQIELTDDEFDRDIEMVEGDLERLKRLMEERA